MTNPADRTRLRRPAYQRRVARGLANGVQAFVGPAPPAP